jgi:hypothetical protein
LVIVNRIGVFVEYITLQIANLHPWLNNVPIIVGWMQTAETAAKSGSGAMGVDRDLALNRSIELLILPK